MLRSSGQCVLHQDAPYYARYNSSFRQYSGRNPTSRVRSGGALNHLGEMKMGSWRGRHDVWERTNRPEKLKAPEGSSLRTCSPAVWAAADSGSRGRSSSERAWADAKTAVGGGGSFGNEAYQLSIGLFREGHRPDSPKWTPRTSLEVRCHSRGTKTPVFEARS